MPTEQMWQIIICTTLSLRSNTHKIMCNVCCGGEIERIFEFHRDLLTGQQRDVSVPCHWSSNTTYTVKIYKRWLSRKFYHW